MRELERFTSKSLEECTPLELFNGLLDYTVHTARQRGYHEGKKKVYYLSAEFLLGKLLSNNLVSLGLYEMVQRELAAAGRSLAELEDLEREPSLGNGGLGRLAACFLDSMATLGIPADGVGLNYHCGLFRQSLTEGKQTETPDRWLSWGQRSWLRRTDCHFELPLGDQTVRSTMYELDVTGFGSRCGRLRLFDLDTVDERIIRNGIDFDKTDVRRNLTLFLYPDDSDEAGRLLRVYQEYFLSANAARLILRECRERGSSLWDLADYAAVQINDTHPSLVIPELVYLLTGEGIDRDSAYRIVTDTCAYTNHTILAEALETWPMAYLERVTPHLIPVLREMDETARQRSADPFTRIVDGKKNVHMANLDIHFSHSINGVARLHTEILKHTELKPFYEIYPEKFNSKTNGVTFRRWLLACNPELAALITEEIGSGWIRNGEELENLLPFAEDESFLRRLLSVKEEKKRQFSLWLEEISHVSLDPDSIFDVQAKRLHEYKRQQLNLLWAIDRYRRIKQGQRPARPITAIFGAKAAPAYTTAKDIIHAIAVVSKVLEEDGDVRPWLRVIMLENYNVTAAEKLMPAADLSEQISLASKEASGTGNMKFMLNGAVTVGTMDGANVEICEAVGRENFYGFGLSSDQVIHAYAAGDYRAKNWYRADKRLAAAVDFLVGEEMTDAGDEGVLARLHRELVEKDWFMTFPDFRDYCETKDRALADYEDRMAWAKKMAVNVAKAGFFSADRTIRQYDQEIWHAGNPGESMVGSDRT